MRPDSAARLIFGTASAVGRATRTHAQPEACNNTIGIALQDVAAGIEAATRRVSLYMQERIHLLRYVLLLGFYCQSDLTVCRFSVHVYKFVDPNLFYSLP